MLSIRKFATLGVSLIFAAVYALNAGYYIPGAIAAVVGLTCVTPFALEWVETRKYIQREKKMRR